MRYQEILRRLAIIDEGFVGDQAGLVLSPSGAKALDPKTPALVRVGVMVAIGAPEVEDPDGRWRVPWPALSRITHYEAMPDCLSRAMLGDARSDRRSAS